MIATLLWIAAALVAVVLLVASLPLRLRLRARAGPRPAVRVQGSALGLPFLTFVDSDRGRTRVVKPDDGPDNPDEDPTGEAVSGWRRPPRGSLAFLRDIVGRIRIVRFRATGALGLGDPADTGVAFGLLTPLIYGAQSKVIHLDVRPVFDRLHVSGDLDATVEFRLIVLVPPTARFGWRNLRARFA